MSGTPSASKAGTGEGEGKDEALAALRLDALSAGGGMEALTEGVPKKRVPTHLVMLAGLVLVAGGSLFVMRKLGMGPISASGEVKIDYDASNVVVSDHQRVLQDLTSSHIEQQVPKEQVQRNPFRITDGMGQLFDVKSVPTEDMTVKAAKEEAERLQREREERANLLKTTAESLALHSVMGGSNPIARIGSETVRVGDTVAELFKVRSIQGRTVEIEADGAVFVLTMDEHGSERGGHAPASKPSKKP